MSQNKKDEIIRFSIPDMHWHKFTKQAHQKLFGNLLGVIKCGRVLDAGCGNGIFGSHLAKAGFEVIGVDIALTSLHHGKKMVYDSGLSIEFIGCDLEYLPFRKRTFDVCVCGNILHHFPVLNKVIQELSSTIKHRGRLIVFEPNGINPFAKILNDSRSPLRSPNVTSNERVRKPVELMRVLRTEGFRDFVSQSLDNIYVSPLSSDGGKLVRRLISYIVFYVLSPALDKFLPRSRRGFYIMLRCYMS